MRIAFDFFGIGCGNNGGTRTCIRSANELVDQGHEVYIFSHCKNYYTWDELKCEHIEQKYPFHFPEVDVIIATGAGTAAHAVQFPYKKVGVYWIRGIEVWSKPLNYLIYTYNLELKLMTNSLWQKRFIEKQTNRLVDIQYPGLEIDFFTPPKKKPERITIGGLYHPAKHKGWVPFSEILAFWKDSIQWKILTANKTGLEIQKRQYKYIEIIESPTEKEKREMYRNCHIWLATTHLDGLHLPPMEAGLCGAALVANGENSSGMSDHAIHEETAFVYETIPQAINYISLLVDSPEFREELNYKHRNVLMEKMRTRSYQMRKLAGKFEKFLEEK